MGCWLARRPTRGPGGLWPGSPCCGHMCVAPRGPHRSQAGRRLPRGPHRSQCQAGVSSGSPGTTGVVGAAEPRILWTTPTPGWDTQASPWASTAWTPASHQVKLPCPACHCPLWKGQPWEPLGRCRRVATAEGGPLGLAPGHLPHLLLVLSSAAFLTLGAGRGVQARPGLAVLGREGG